MYFLNKILNILHNFIPKSVSIFSSKLPKNNINDTTYTSPSFESVEGESGTISTLYSHHHQLYTYCTNSIDTNTSKNIIFEEEDYEFIDNISSSFFIFYALKETFEDTYKMNEETNLFQKYYKNNHDKYKSLKVFADHFIKQCGVPHIRDDIYYFCLKQLLEQLSNIFREFLLSLPTKQYILLDIQLFLDNYEQFVHDYNELSIMILNDGILNELYRIFLSN